MSKSYYKYWGKAKAEDGGYVNYHLLPYHCLDVAAVAAAWWEKSAVIRQSMMGPKSVNEEHFRAWVLFFIALHDYGKFDVRFQMKVKKIWQQLYLRTGSYNLCPSEHDCREYAHGESGLFWFKSDHGNLLGIQDSDGLDFLDEPNYEDSVVWQKWKKWLEAVTGHHGHLKSAEWIVDKTLPSTYDKEFGDIDRHSRKDWLNAIEEIYLIPAGLSMQSIPPDCPSLIAGFCSVSDWLGSRSDFRNFTFRKESHDLKDYFEERVNNDAVRILKLAGIISQPRPYSGFTSLLETNHSPRSVQTLVDDLPLKAGLSVIEAPTGSGKTEAALAYAWRLIEAGFAESIIFALPTQASANAMLERIERFARKLFSDNPNVVLAHGSSRFNEEFTKLKHAALKDLKDDDGWTQCSEWLAESRKRVFLGQIGVCTVDQVLISVLPVRHWFVRSFGIGRSILIIDEVHAYDAYMYGLLEEVLKDQKSAGGSAILLSATLPEFQRRQLAQAWDLALIETQGLGSYPLLTWCGNSEVILFKLADSEQPDDVTVKLEPIKTDDMLPDDSLIHRIIKHRFSHLPKKT